jgi:hypothetical protein
MTPRQTTDMSTVRLQFAAPRAAGASNEMIAEVLGISTQQATSLAAMAAMEPTRREEDA